MASMFAPMWRSLGQGYSERGFDGGDDASGNRAFYGYGVEVTASGRHCSSARPTHYTMGSDQSLRCMNGFFSARTVHISGFMKDYPGPKVTSLPKS